MRTRVPSKSLYRAILHWSLENTRTWIDLQRRRRDRADHPKELALDVQQGPPILSAQRSVRSLQERVVRLPSLAVTVDVGLM